MDTHRLNRLLSSGENERVEYKLSLPSLANLGELLASIANTKGGDILIGVKDDGSISGIKKPEKIKSDVKKAAEQYNDPPIKISQEYASYNDKDILIINVPKSNQIHFTKKNKYLRRVGDKTINVSKTRLSDGTRVYSESGTVSYIQSFNVPNLMHPGDETIKRALAIRPHKKKIGITFLWGDQSIKVVGAHMIEPNIFEFPSDEETRTWYLKFCVDNSVAVDCKKQVYINVDVISQNKWIYYPARIAAYSLIALSFLPVISTLLNEGIFLSLSIAGAFSIPIPLVTIISFILLSRRINVAIQRLSSIKLTTNTKYNEKAITDPDNIQLQTIKIVKKNIDNYHNDRFNNH